MSVSQVPYGLEYLSIRGVVEPRGLLVHLQDEVLHLQQIIIRAEESRKFPASVGKARSIDAHSTLSAHVSGQKSPVVPRA